MMQVAFHVGVAGTEETAIRSCLVANRPRLAEHRVELSSNRINEPVLGEALRALQGGVASPAMEEVVLDALIEDEDTTRLIVSRPTLVGLPRRAFLAEGVFAGSGARMRALADLLPGCRCEFFVALRNPATLLPALLGRSSSTPDAPPPEELTWLPALREMAAGLGGRRLVVWCNEDAPFVLPEAIRSIAGLPADAALDNDNPVLDRILSSAGLKRLAGRLENVAPGDVAERRRHLAEVLARHHQKEAISLAVDMPGWDQAAVDLITARYDAEVAEIAALPGVEFLAP